MPSTTNGMSEQAEVTSTRHLQVLLDADRRIAVELLADASEMPLEALAREVTRRSGGTREAETLEVLFHHKHLPVLAEVGAVDYDAAAGRIRPHRPTIDDLNRLREQSSAVGTG